MFIEKLKIELNLNIKVYSSMSTRAMQEALDGPNREESNVSYD